jgi:predicted ATPase
MIESFAIGNYRSLLSLVAPLAGLNIVTGPNGSGKSNLYKGLRLLSETATGGLIGAVAHEGGLESAFWAGPEKLSPGMKDGSVPVQGGPRGDVMRLRLGFAGEDFGYAISLGLPQPGRTSFNLDPEIKRECIWAGPVYRPASCLVDRQGPVVKIRNGRSWQVYAKHLNSYNSMLAEIADPIGAPEIFTVRETIRNWRFYDHFRTDKESRIRIPQIGTRTPVLDHDGHDLAAALQTIIEIGDHEALHEAVSDAFPGARIEIRVDDGAKFSVTFYQHGLLRPLDQSELSDGTLRYLLLVSALLTPRPPSLLVLNEPETSLHPDLLPALAKLIVRASTATQVWVVSHASRLVAALEESSECNSLPLEKELGQTLITGQGMLDQPPWYWPDKR